jgi:hypothetical protein
MERSVKFKLAMALVLLTIFALPSGAGAVVLGPYFGDWDGTESTQLGRLFRNGTPSNGTKAFPGAVDTSNPYYYETFSFNNNGGADLIKIDVQQLDLYSAHLVAYLDSFTPGDHALNYLGDLGATLSQAFSVDVPGGSQFIIVAEAIDPAIESSTGSVGKRWSFTVEGKDISGSTPVPEPGTMMLLGSGLVGLAGYGRKKLKK